MDILVKSRIVKERKLTALFLFTIGAFYACVHESEVVPVLPEIVPPTGLSYSPNYARYEYLTGGKSVLPDIKGTLPIAFIINTEPAAAGGIAIDSLGILTTNTSLDTGTYVIHVTATNSGGATTFKNVFTITVVETPDPPSDLMYSLNKITTDHGTAARSVVPTLNGTMPFSYEINTRPTTHGEISINEEGVILISDISPVGEYWIDVSVKNKMHTVRFDSIYHVAVVAVLPFNLEYSPASMTLVAGNPGGSSVPSIKGTLPIQFSASVNPADSNITIDAITGVISNSAGLAPGSYKINVTASNLAGRVEFREVYTIETLTNDKPVTALTYEPGTLHLMQGNSGSSVVPSITGTSPVTFEITSTPPEAGITIDHHTGIISANSSVPPGTYQINTKATNALGPVSFNDVYTISISPLQLPSNLAYPDNTVTVDEGSAWNSDTPGINGTLPIAYGVTSLPTNDAITINGSGVINVAATSSAGIYVITVNASNAAGEVAFKGVYTILVEAPSITFTKDIKPVIVNKCSACHNPGLQTNYTEYAKASTRINLILDRVQRTPGSPGAMPLAGIPLTSDEINLLKTWLDQGLKE
jgi:hypothetical protein